MMITKIKITKTFEDGIIKAIVSVVINGFYNFWDIQIIQGMSRLFVAMPNSYEEEKLFSINEVETYPEERQDFERCILDAYNKYVEASKAYTDYLNQYTVYETSKTKRSGFMSISDIKVKKISNNNNLKALVSVKLDDCIVINDIQIIQSEDRLLVVMPGTESELAMPSCKDENGDLKYIVHLVYSDSREQLQRIILDKYLELYKDMYIKQLHLKTE